MPIGKNAIKRVENNGYSKVETKAPDMEHSVIAKPDKQVEEKLIKPVAEKCAKKTAKKSATTKSASKKKEVKAQKDGFERVSLGGEMPFYLL